MYFNEFVLSAQLNSSWIASVTFIPDIIIRYVYTGFNCKSHTFPLHRYLHDYDSSFADFAFKFFLVFIPVIR